MAQNNSLTAYHQQSLGQAIIDVDSQHLIPHNTRDSYPYQQNSTYSYGIGASSNIASVPQTLSDQQYYNGPSQFPGAVAPNGSLQIPYNTRDSYPYQQNSTYSYGIGASSNIASVPQTLSDQQYYNGPSQFPGAVAPNGSLQIPYNTRDSYPYQQNSTYSYGIGASSNIASVPQTLSDQQYYNGPSQFPGAVAPNGSLQIPYNTRGSYPYRQNSTYSYGIGASSNIASVPQTLSDQQYYNGPSQFPGAVASNGSLQIPYNTRGSYPYQQNSTYSYGIGASSNIPSVPQKLSDQQYYNGPSQFPGAVASNGSVECSNSSVNIRKRAKKSIQMDAAQSSIFGDNTKTSTDKNNPILPPALEFPRIDPTLSPIEQVLANINPNRRSCDSSQMTVQASDPGAERKRYMCVFCRKLCLKLPRHLEKVHKDEADVQKLNSLPMGSKERKEILEILRKRGMFEFNSNKMLNQGQLVTSRRPNAKFSRTAENFRACPKCLGMYSIKGDHIRKCCKDAFNGKRMGTAMSVAVEKRIHQLASHRLELVCRPLRNTVNVQTVKFDWILIVFGNKQCKKYPLKKHERLIRQKLRMCGRLLCELKSINKNITDFAALFNPRHYDDVLQAVRVIGQFNSTTNEFATPSSALDALLQVKDVGKDLICQCIRANDSDLLKRTENFLKLLENDASASIYKSIYDSLARIKRLKVDHLPTTEDIKAMVNYLVEEINKCSNLLNQEFCLKKWVELSELILAWIVVFNRKRPGESQYILTNEFRAREQVDSETLDTLPAEDKLAAERYVRMRVCGKKGRTVPLLLTTDIVNGIKILLKYREAAEISPENGFLFALPSIDNGKVIEAYHVVKKYSTLCGANEPTTIRGTMLRKHVATLCVSKKYDDTDVGYVAEFLGHHERIQRQCYRRNPMVDEVVKISKLLESAKGDTDDGRKGMKGDTGDQSKTTKRGRQPKNIQASADVKKGRKRNSSQVLAEPQKKPRTK